MTIALSTVTESISNISISGITIQDIDELKSEYLERDCPILIPNPAGFVSNFRLERQSFGTGASCKWDVRYTLTYRFLHSLVGTGRQTFDTYSDMVEKATSIVDAIILNDAVTGAVDLTLQDVISFGPVGDPSGILFHGCDIALEVLEFAN